MANRAAVGVIDWKRTKADLHRLARALDAGKRLGEADFELGFAQAGDLVAEITRERLRLLATLRETGPLTVYALALVPWKEIRIRLPLAKAA